MLKNIMVIKFITLFLLHPIILLLIITNVQNCNRNGFEVKSSSCNKDSDGAYCPSISYSHWGKCTPENAARPLFKSARLGQRRASGPRSVN